mmetsp:Transcript_23655/g.75437  ORF Transcript_23655/g.75437 Transcript_23655/m.75437 type:complete len:324 (+) Transcript_23655:1-972(+)
MEGALRAVLHGADGAAAAALRASGMESTAGERKAFAIGAATGAGVLAAVTVWRALRSRGGRPKRSLLHHLDARATRYNSSNRPAQAALRFRSHGSGPSDGASVATADDSDPRHRIFQVVLTGGPCAGKSSAMEFLAERLREMAFDVYLVPEVPTLLLNGGCVYPGLDGGERLVTFEASLIELQLQMEQTFYNVARSTGRPSVILYDRGLLDVAAYLPRALWNNVLNYNQWVRDGMLGVLERYDLILHLVTAANGAEKHFLQHGEAANDVSLQQARELDSKIHSSYQGHPHHHVVDNSTDFPRKLERVFEFLLDMIRRSSIDVQ